LSFDKGVRGDYKDKQSKIFSLYTIIPILLSLLLGSLAFAQGRPMTGSRMGGGGGSIFGRVLDSELQKPIEYATVILMSQRDSSQVSGISTDENGKFDLTKIRPGRYYLQISFLGYDLKTIDTILIRPGNLTVDLGDIPLVQSSLNIKGVEVTAEKPPIEFKIDKRVINVDQQLASTSGTAVDVLENAPSVTVDIEGNVQLRGSSNFTVLIDGRPTILDANDVLQQTPAGSIENIEIITNPSAKYDPDGTSGIINLVMKKKKLRGISGILNSNGGFDNRYGGDALVNYRNGDYNAFASIDYNKRNHPGSSLRENQTTYSDTTSYVYSSGESKRGGTRYGGRGGLEFNLSQNDVLSVGGRIGDFSGKHSSQELFEEWTEPGGVHNIYTNDDTSDRTGKFLSANMNYDHQFNGNSHKLSAQMVIMRRDMDSESHSTLVGSDGVMTFGQKSIESGPGRQFRARVDYTRPIREKGKFEAGYQSRIESSEDKNELYNYDSLQAEYVFQSPYSHSTDYDRTIHSLYFLNSGEMGRFGYQVGLRGEYTYRNINLVGENESFNIDRWDYFPTLHSSFQLSNSQQVMASYARRIDRPRGWFLEPFETWSDAYNVRRGNPGLKPEYIDSYELSYQKSFGKNMIALETYYRITHNKIEFVNSVYPESTNVMLRTVENVGADYSLGSELTLNLSPFHFWDINASGSVYNYRVEGALYGKDYSEQKFSWHARLNNNINIGKKARIQLSGRYQSKTVTSQGQRDGNFMANLALRYDFIVKVLSATLQVRDIFGSGKYENISEGINFYNYSRFDRKAPMVSLTLTYNFNNFKQQRNRVGDTDTGIEDMGGGEEY
jgi:outer membrane cobalamin receptor